MYKKLLQPTHSTELNELLDVTAKASGFAKDTLAVYTLFNAADSKYHYYLVTLIKNFREPAGLSSENYPTDLPPESKTLNYHVLGEYTLSHFTGSCGIGILSNLYLTNFYQRGIATAMTQLAVAQAKLKNWGILLASDRYRSGEYTSKIATKLGFELSDYCKNPNSGNQIRTFKKVLTK